MSVESLTWAFQQAPDVASHEMPVLLGLANHAHPDGSGAWPSIPTLARYARKGERAVAKDLASLLKKGVIRKGDQRHVAHIPVDRRPTVYDLAMERRLDGGIVQSPVKPVSGKAHVSLLPPPQIAAQRETSRPGTPGRAVSAPAVKGPLKGGKRCPLPGHQGYLMASCTACKAERLGGAA